MPLEKPDIFNATGVFREMGIKFSKLEKYEKSLPYFDQALKRSPEDMRALKGRAMCRAQACKYNDALKDVATMQAIVPDDIYVLGSECLIKYLCCEFERAMMENLNSIPSRMKPDNFVMGVMHCEDAIQNNVGIRAGHPLRDHFQIIRKLAWQRVFEKAKPYQPKTKYKKKKKISEEEKMVTQLAAPKAKLPLPAKRSRRKSNVSIGTTLSMRKFESEIRENLLSEGSSIQDSLHSIKDSGHQIPILFNYPFKPIQRYTSNVQNLMAERYLDKMYHDKVFLERLKNRLGLESPNENGVRKIKELAKKSSKYIYYNQELLRARRPFYLLRLQDAKAGGKLKERQLERERAMMKYCENEAATLIDKIQMAIRNHNLRIVIESAEKLYSFCETTPKKTLPKRDWYLQQLYALVRDGYYRTKILRSYMNEEQKIARIAVILGLPRDKQGSTDSLLTQFKDYFVDRKKQCKIFQDRVRRSCNRVELVWCYHELSRLHFEQNEYELAKAYVTKSLKESYLLKDDRWVINSMFMMIKVHVVNKNKNGAKIELRQCRRIAKRTDDHKLEDFINESIKVLNNTPMEVMQPTKLLEMRTKNILKLLRSDSIKKEASLIFNRISALPPNKRMSVMPGIVYPTLSSTRLKIDDRSIQTEGSLKLRHRQIEKNDPEQYNRGVSFMEHMQNYLE
ncbi:hypothetical protein HHI36_009567 [Cryptolaemus montrouzieri]|uniref:Tetratricopeptide repeat protein 25 n=1 Tax=Cryptolaemus montrouzieri TaxID=559131 RepID=A0ABD2MG34_9CUCU